MQHPNLKTAFALLSCTVALSACDPVDTLPDGAAPDAMSAVEGEGLTQDGSGIGLTQPAVLQSRAVVRDLLYPRVTLGVDGSSEVTMIRSGERWSGSFSLPPDTGSELARYPLNIDWLYDIRNTTGSPGDDIVLARAPEQIITNASSRQISVGSYTTEFDEDNDGTTNLAELNADRDPLNDDRNASAVTPNDQQSDCRDAPGGIITRFTPILRLSGSFTDTQAIERATGLPAFGQAFFLEAQGTLTVEKVSGLPEESAIVLFDAPVNSTTERIIAADTTEPLRVSTILQPGLYCFIGAVSDAENQVYSDLTVKYTFEP